MDTTNDKICLREVKLTYNADVSELLYFCLHRVNFEASVFFIKHIA